MKSINVFLAISVMLGCLSAQAGKEYKSVRWGMGGCGLGSMFIKDNAKWPQVGAAVINDYFFQCSAITSGTSNCKQQAGKEDARIEQEVFVANNLESLSKEAAQGSGDHLVALAEVFGCDSVKISQLSQSRHNEIFNGDAKAVLKNYRTVIQSDSELAKSCERIS